MTPNKKVFEKEKLALLKSGNHSIPDSLTCPDCRKLIKDVVLIQCYSFCERCICVGCDKKDEGKKDEKKR